MLRGGDTDGQTIGSILRTLAGAFLRGRRCDTRLPSSGLQQTHLAFVLLTTLAVYTMRTTFLLAVAACCVVAAAAMRGPLEPEEIPDYTFERFVQEFSRPYAAGTEEYSVRQALFEFRRAEIVAHNNAGRSWTRTINKYADWTDDERKSLLGYRHPDPNGDHTKYSFPYTPSGVAPAAARDWKQYLTGIKDQGQCGSCYAHSATESVETYVAMTTGKRPVLSQQQGADCTINPNQCGGTGGCGGGTAKIVMASFAEAGGVANVWTYPYTLFWGGATPQCRYNNTNAAPATPAVAAIDGYVEVGMNNHRPPTGPTTTPAWCVPLFLLPDVTTHHDPMQYDGCGDDSWIMDHAVQMVGYGVDNDSGMPYWTVRNSWGVDFGEEGYIRVRRHLNTAADPVPCGMDTNPAAGSGCKDGPPAVKVCGSCGILYSPSFPKNARAL